MKWDNPAMMRRMTPGTKPFNIQWPRVVFMMPMRHAIPAILAWLPGYLSALYRSVKYCARLYFDVIFLSVFRYMFLVFNVPNSPAIKNFIPMCDIVNPSLISYFISIIFIPLPHLCKYYSSIFKMVFSSIEPIANSARPSKETVTLSKVFIVEGLFSKATSALPV